MLLYCTIMLGLSIPMTILGVLIFRGRTDLINCYHQERVTDQKRYARAFGIGVLIVSAAPALSAVSALVMPKTPLFWLGVLIPCLGIGLWQMIHAQKKYNGGIF